MEEFVFQLRVVSSGPGAPNGLPYSSVSCLQHPPRAPTLCVPIRPNPPPGDFLALAHRSGVGRGVFLSGR